MKNSLLTLLTGSVLLSSVLLSGCGETVRTTDTEATASIQPHIVRKESSGLSEEEQVDYADIWENFVAISSTYTRTNQESHNFSIDILCQQGISSDVAHFQIFVDSDNNEDTGLSLGEDENAIIGADYMIEDGLLFKSISNDNWEWTYVDAFNYKTTTEANNAYRIRLSSDSKQITSIIDEENVGYINISMEPISEQWYDTNNYVSTQAVNLKVIGEKEVIVEPKPNPEPIVPNETVYEDAENGLANWMTTKGDNVAIRKTPGYQNQSQAFVKLPNKWYQDENGNWANDSEYQLDLGGDTEHTMISIDLVGDGTEIEHYVLGVKVSTSDGERYLFWDSFYNHENIPAIRTPYGDGNAYMVFPSPIEMVRGYDYSDVYLSENFTVDLAAALKQFEPQNKILSVDTFIATGGQLDNIKLFSK